MLKEISLDPGTAALPVTVLSDSNEDRLATLTVLRNNHLHYPVVVLEGLRTAEGLQAIAPLPLRPDAEEGAWIVGGAGRRARRAPPRRRLSPAP